MVFNGSAVRPPSRSGGVDPLTDALLAQKARFRWVNHAYTHPFLGCVQIAATVVGGRWSLRHLGATETPRMDPEVDEALGPDGVYYAYQPFVTDRRPAEPHLGDANALPNYDPVAASPVSTAV